jgi:hypothetical protein
MGILGLIACVIAAIMGFSKGSPVGIAAVIVGVICLWSLGVMSNYPKEQPVSDPGERVAVTVNILSSIAGFILLIVSVLLK